MSEKDNGGPAFGEFKQLGQVAVKEGGMTLRDYFAAKAMEAYLIAKPTDRPEMIDVAATAYAMADAMLEARKQ